MDTTTLTSCPVCGKNKFTALTQPGHWIGNGLFDPLKDSIGLMRCDGCSLVFINPRPNEAALNAFYSGDTYTCHESAGSASAGAKAEFLLDRIAESASKDAPQTLLDFGCGGGGFLRHALRRNWDAWGFEPGRRGCEVCKEAGLNVTDQLDSVPTGFFGLITMHHVFEHLDDHRAVLDQIRKLLAPDGQLFIEVPNAKSLRAQLSAPFLSQHMNFDERYRAYPIHLSYFNERALTLLMQSAGWKVDHVFTAGLGIEELVIRDHPSRPDSAPVANSDSGSRRSSSSPLRSAVKGMIYGAGLGENLCIVARPGN